jgi:hypothetical protein
MTFYPLTCWFSNVSNNQLLYITMIFKKNYKAAGFFLSFHENHRFFEGFGRTTSFKNSKNRPTLVPTEALMLVCNI